MVSFKSKCDTSISLKNGKWPAWLSLWPGLIFYTVMEQIMWCDLNCKVTLLLITLLLVQVLTELLKQRTCCGWIFPGHQPIAGSLIPPSKVVSFPHRNGPLLPPTATHPDNSTQERTIAPSYSNTHGQFNTGTDHCSLLQQHTRTIQHRNRPLLPPTATHPDNSTQERTIAPSYSNTSRQFNTGMDHCSLLQQHIQTIQHMNGPLLPPAATHSDNSTHEWTIAPSYSNTSRQFNTWMDHCSLLQQSRQFNTGTDHCSLLQQHIQTIQHRNGPLLPPTATHPDNST